jgi:hypothetical protein
MTEAEFYAGYDEWLEDQEKMCGASLTMGPAHDSYGTSCELDKGHYPATDHKGPHPIADDEEITWTGGGSCAGDPLPYSITTRR